MAFGMPNVPVMAQGGWMERPVVPGCPPGLEYLTQVDQFLVHQAVELLEAFTDIECRNRFQIKNSAGQQIYYAAEDSNFCCRQFCKAHRSFSMHIADNFGQEVIRTSREFKCCAGCCWCAFSDCCAYEMAVEAPVGNVVGYVRQTCSFIKPRFEIQDTDHQPVLYMEGPICICECPCFDVEFTVYTMDDTPVGRLSKQWAGLVKEFFTQADNFGINFPMDLDVKMKACLIAAVFLVNAMFFESQGNDN